MTYTEKVEQLYSDLRSEVIKLVQANGKDSKVGYQTIKLSSLGARRFFHLDNGVVIKEIGENILFDENGYHYSFVNLRTEDFCCLIDDLKNLYQ